MRYTTVLAGSLPLLLCVACAAMLDLDAGQAREAIAYDGGDAAGPASPAILDVAKDATPTANDAEAIDAAGEAEADDAGALTETGTVADAADIEAEAEAEAPIPRPVGTILCGALLCTINVTECAACPGGSMQCVPQGSAAAGCSIATCDDFADCPSGSRCCATAPSVTVSEMVASASCATSCGSKYPLCDPAKADCPATTTCKPFSSYFACQH